MSAFLSIEDFRKLAREKKTAGAALCKAFPSTAKAAEDGSVEFVISTATPDRVGDVVAVDGWELEAYQKNPIVLWAHDKESPPIGRALEVSNGDGALRARAEFCKEDLYPFGAMIGRMVKEGYLSATSVGFRPLKFGFNEERGDGAMDFEKQELLEFSVVPVPANPEALIAAKAAGIDLAPMFAWAEKALDIGAASGLWVPRANIERARQIAKGARRSRVPMATRAPAEGEPPAAPEEAPPQGEPEKPDEPVKPKEEEGDEMGARLEAVCARLEKIADALEAREEEEEEEEEEPPAEPQGDESAPAESAPAESGKQYDPAKLAAAVVKLLRERGNVEL
jgi:HK97 family phage prohead protease